MPLMNVFEPLFVLLVLAAVSALAMAAACALRGRRGRAGRIVRRLVIGAALYLGIVIAVSAMTPRRVYDIGDTQCFDDWCIQVLGAQWTGSPTEARYEVALQLSNRAQRVPMGEKGAVVYLVDAQGRRYDPVAREQDVPFDARLEPGESVRASRLFIVPRATPNLGLVFTHEGGFPIGWFIITEGGWFSKPPIVRLT